MFARDAVGSGFGGDGADEAEQPGLGRGHRSGVGPSGYGGLPAEGDDAAALALQHSRQDGLAQVEGGIQICVHYLQPFFIGHFGDGPVRTDSDV